MSTLGALSVGLLVLVLLVAAGIVVLAQRQRRSRTRRDQPRTVADLVRMREAAAGLPAPGASRSPSDAAGGTGPGLRAGEGLVPNGSSTGSWSAAGSAGSAPTAAALGAGPTGSGISYFGAAAHLLPGSSSGASAAAEPADAAAPPDAEPEAAHSPTSTSPTSNSRTSTPQTSTPQTSTSQASTPPASVSRPLSPTTTDGSSAAAAPAADAPSDDAAPPTISAESADSTADSTADSAGSSAGSVANAPLPSAAGSGPDAPWMRAAQMTDPGSARTTQPPGSPVGEPGSPGPRSADEPRSDADASRAPEAGSGRSEAPHSDAAQGASAAVPEPRPVVTPPPPRSPFGNEQYRSGTAAVPSMPPPDPPTESRPPAPSRNGTASSLAAPSPRPADSGRLAVVAPLPHTLTSPTQTIAASRGAAVVLPPGTASPLAVVPPQADEPIRRTAVVLPPPASTSAVRAGSAPSPAAARPAAAQPQEDAAQPQEDTEDLRPASSPAAVRSAAAQQPDDTEELGPRSDSAAELSAGARQDDTEDLRPGPSPAAVRSAAAQQPDDTEDLRPRPSPAAALSAGSRQREETEDLRPGPFPAAARSAAAQPREDTEDLRPGPFPAAALSAGGQQQDDTEDLGPRPSAASVRTAGRARRDPADTAAEQAAADLALLRTFGLTGRPHVADEETELQLTGSPVVAAPASGVAQSVAFRVTHRDGLGVAGASVTLLDDHGREIASSVTDADGCGALTAQHSGGYVLVTAAAGYQPGAMAIAPDGPADVAVQLTRSASITGAVSGEDGPIVGVDVDLVQDGEIVDTAVSGVDGAYRFTDLAAGEYGLSVCAPECEPAAVVVRLAEEVALRRDLDLDPAGLPAEDAVGGDVMIGRL